ncbi:hypothetical protein PWT90_09190 [Aphanocladium album]|nr:hypothetical protein PWT90_09190 [Aphanocladium album]
MHFAGIDAKHDSLPFSSIEVEPDCTSVKFLLQGKEWQFGPDGELFELRELEEDEEWEYASSVDSVSDDEDEDEDDNDGSDGDYNEEGAVVDDGDDDSAESSDNDDDQEEVDSDQGNEDGSETSNTPQRRVTVEGNALWLEEEDGRRKRVSSSVRDEGEFDEKNIFLSPDENFAVVWQYTPEQEHIVHFVESTPKDQLQPKLHSNQYLKPGDKVRIDRPRLYNLDTRREVPTRDSLFSNPFELRNIGWSEDGDEYRFIYNERGHQNLSVLGMDTQGRVRVLVSEVSPTFIDYSTKMYWKVVDGSEELIWASERDGFNHLYLFDMATGTMKNQITCGLWNVAKVDRVDFETRRIWFKGYGLIRDQDPYYAHLARVNFDGSNLRVLTSGDGTHRWKWSPDERYFVDIWSRVDVPPQVLLRDADTGHQILFLEGVPPQDLQLGPWNPPQRFAAYGRDGQTLIYGVIILPPHFDERRSYPVLESIYAGPTGFDTPKAFTLLEAEREWAALGFVVVVIDGMGTNWRSKAFHDVCFKNLADGGFPDRIAWMRAAARARPWMDLSRVGIFGGSAGGQNAAAAVLHHGDFYKAAAADCGCHDNRMDKIWWNEQWMGYPVDESYAQSSNATHAGKLQGPLMLLVGEVDSNVDPASTMQLAAALNEADKEYELSCNHNEITNVLSLRARIQLVNRVCKDWTFDTGVAPSLAFNSIYYGWNETCAKDPNGQYCNDMIDKFTLVEKAEDMPKDEMCSYCWTSRLQMMQASPLSAYVVDSIFKHDLEVVNARCGLNLPTDPQPPPEKPPSNPSYCLSNSYYTTAAGDNCTSIALAHGVSSADLLNGNREVTPIANCTTVPVGVKLCLPLGCKTYTIKDKDTCDSIGYDNSIAPETLMQAPARILVP